MKVMSKAQITLKALLEHDELITYSVEYDGTCTCIKTRVIDGKRVYIVDHFCPYKSTINIPKWISSQYSTLASAKKRLVVNHF